MSHARFLPSITRRLILGLTVATTVIWCVAATYSTYISYRELNESFDRALQEVSRRLLPLASDDVFRHERDDARAIDHLLDGREEYLSYQLRDAAGNVVLRAHDAPDLPYQKTVHEGFSTVGGYRLYTTRSTENGLTITVAETTRGRWEALVRSATALLWPLVILLPLNMWVILMVVRLSMRPVLQLSSEIAARGERNLQALDISGQPAELNPIAEAVAHLIERLRAALDAERAFAAVSAHELRTPIAGALAQTQRLLAELEGAHDLQRAREIEQTLKRLAALAEKLMQISRLEAGMASASSMQDLGPVLDLVVADARAHVQYPQRIVYERAKAVTLSAPIDLDAFAMAARNLIDNALMHGDGSEPVTITVPEANVVSISNGGAVVAADMLAGLKDRFARGATGVTGSGLGLAIADSIMLQTGGALELRSPRSGKRDGFEAVLRLGLDAQDPSASPS